MIRDVDRIDYQVEGMDLKFPEILKKYKEAEKEIENLEKNLGGLNAQFSSLKNEGYAENFAQKIYKKSKEKYDQEFKIFEDNIKSIEKSM